MDLKEIIKNLTSKNGISGDEFPASKCACELLDEYLDCRVDSFGNVYGEPKYFDEKKPTILLDAHIDEIGMIVTYITDEGFLKVSNCGGVDTRVLLAQEVEILCEEKIIKGVITSTPPHLETDNTKASEINDIFVDIGLSKEQAERIVSLGDRVYINNDFTSLEKDKITSNALDDRSGVASILYALELLKDIECKCNIAVLFSCQEEVGEIGAEIGAYNVAPDMAIAVDVSFAKTTGESPCDCGEMCKGPMIGVAPTLSKEVSKALINTAKANNIPYQIEVMNGKTGTNADAITVSKGGVKTCTVSIPLKYMHTPVEVVSIVDVENTGKLIAKFCESGY